MSNEIKKVNPNCVVQLVEGEKGIFEVWEVFDGCAATVLFSKEEENRFPITGEIGKLIQEK